MDTNAINLAVDSVQFSSAVVVTTFSRIVGSVRSRFGRDLQFFFVRFEYKYNHE